MIRQSRRAAVAALAVLFTGYRDASARKDRVQQGDVRVVNSGSGDVNVDQSVQIVDYSTSGVGDGNLVTSPCRPGEVWADPDTGLLYYHGRDCCYHLARCCS